ncbi:MAG: hypothetical protein NTW91_02985 [Verrucomicrobia bacterium]|nr:hypothetical protein [Verrucomicrobiota bacterium]
MRVRFPLPAPFQRDAALLLPRRIPDTASLARLASHLKFEGVAASSLPTLDVPSACSTPPF